MNKFLKFCGVIYLASVIYSACKAIYLQPRCKHSLFDRKRMFGHQFCGRCGKRDPSRLDLPPIQIPTFDFSGRD